MENRITTWIICDMEWLIVFGSHRFSNYIKCFSFKISRQQNPEPANTNISSQPEQSQTPTSRARGGCAASRNFVQREWMQHRRGLFLLTVVIYMNLTLPSEYFCSQCQLYLQVKNVYQTSFSAFLDSLDLSRSPDFPQVWRQSSYHLLYCLV